MRLEVSIMDDLIDYVGIDAKHSYEDKIMPVQKQKRNTEREYRYWGACM